LVADLPRFQVKTIIGTMEMILTINFTTTITLGTVGMHRQKAFGGVNSKRLV
jgi:hypothetical protein